LSPRSRGASAGLNLVSLRLRVPSSLHCACLQGSHRLHAYTAASAHHALCNEGTSASASWLNVSRARAQGASLSTQCFSCYWAPCPLHLACRPNPSLKRDCQRRATRPAQPLVQSSASRAWRHTVGSRLAPTLGLHEQHCLWAHHGSPQAARPDNLSSLSQGTSTGLSLVQFRLRHPAALYCACLRGSHRLQAYKTASAHQELCIERASLAASWLWVFRGRAQGASLSTQRSSCSWAPRTLHLACRPNQSLKPDHQRRATRPAWRLVQSSTTRAWRHTVGGRLAPTLGPTAESHRARYASRS
jgi:hypothetical protein